MNPVQFPNGVELTKLLDLKVAGGLDLDDLFAQVLTNPVGDFFARPRKNVRNQLVELGFMIAARARGLTTYDRELLRRTCEILEIFHAGSLVVDDIEDGSLYRRGQKSLHNVYGIPLALNAGNWMYFLPFKLIDDMDLPDDRRFALARECQNTLLRAHYGQALDLGISIENLEQEKVASIAVTAMELKAGVLTGLALSAGAIVLGADARVQEDLNRFGRKIGVALQMFDDLGNLSSSQNPDKKCEDLRLRRVGYVFGIASKRLSPDSFQQLIRWSESLPETCDEILALLENHDVMVTAHEEASDFLTDVIHKMQADLKLKRLEREKMDWLKSCLTKAYE